MKFLISVTFLVAVVGIGTFAGKTPFTRFLADFRFCKSKNGLIGVSMDKIVSNFLNGIEQDHRYYCLTACMIERANISFFVYRDVRAYKLNMTRIAELTMKVTELQTTRYKKLVERLVKCFRAANNRGDLCHLVAFSIECAIPVKHTMQTR